jgi:hypothetical protein
VTGAEKGMTAFRGAFQTRLSSTRAVDFVLKLEAERQNILHDETPQGYLHAVFFPGTGN